MVAQTPTRNGIDVMQNDSYLKNLSHIALGGKNSCDFSFHGFGSHSFSPTLPEFIGDRPERALNYHINKVFVPGHFILDANTGGDPSSYFQSLQQRA